MMKPRRTARRVVGRDDWPRLLAAAGSCRNRVLLALALYSGLRVAELCALDVADVDLVQGRVRVPGGAAEACVPLPDRARELMAAYLESRERPATGPLFLAASGGRLGLRQLFRIVRAAGTAGLGHDLSPRDLCYSCAAALRASGAGVKEVKEYLRHADIRTTRRMLRVRR
jgi:integrase/recombinase XerC